MSRSGLLVIIRHGESVWNAHGVWTGTTDVGLDEAGFEEAKRMGEALTDVHFDLAYASTLMRTQQTLDTVLEAAHQPDVPRNYASAINERDYGDFTGKNKWEVKVKIGEEAFNHLRRDWDYPVPNGETLKMVSARTLPFYLQTILPQLLEAKNILVVAHGNSIRSLVQYIEQIPTDKVASIEMLFGQALIYQVDGEGHMVSRAFRQIEVNPSPA